MSQAIGLAMAVSSKLTAAMRNAARLLNELMTVVPGGFRIMRRRYRLSPAKLVNS